MPSNIDTKQAEGASIVFSICYVPIMATPLTRRTGSDPITYPFDNQEREIRTAMPEESLLRMKIYMDTTSKE